MIVKGTRLHTWLRRVPMPSHVRCDGKRLIQVGLGKARWRDLIISIDAMGPNMIECLDSEGNVLRATTLEAADDDDDDKPPAEASASKGEPGEHRDVAIARLVLEATDRGSQRNAEAYKLGFDKLASLVEMLLARTTALEGIWQRTLENRAADLEKQGDDGGGLEGMLAAVLPGLMKSEAAKAVATPPNGKAAKS